MKILMTGASGFLGASVCARLLRDGHEVSAIVREGTALPAALREVARIEQNLATLDVSALDAQTDALITLAQFRDFRDVPQRANDLVDVNVNANHRLFAWAASHGVPRIVHASSGGVYGGRRGHRFAEREPLAVDASLGLYLASKACAELLLQAYRTMIPSITTLRPFFIYGPGMPADRLIARLIHSVLVNDPIALDGADGLQMNPVYVDDAAEMVVRALALSGTHTVNVAGSEILSLRDLCILIGSKVGIEPLFSERNHHALDYVADTTLSRSLFGAPSVSLTDGIARTVAEFTSRSEFIAELQVAGQ